MTANTKQQLANWQSQIASARCEDHYRLRQMLQRLRVKFDDAPLAKFESTLAASIKKVSEAAKNTPAIHFPEQLPVSQRRAEISELIQQNQILILAGETGSGKTTQLPKICLSLGYGSKGLIGHTQPRRIAARTVADRIASELKTPLGATVGYQVRFNDVSSQQTQVKLMTDGVLLAEFQRDRFLSRYEVIIIDEAHERSLNIDFLLGLLKPLCLKRPDLKIIITSATIDLDKFSKHFTVRGKAAPVIEVSGRTFPVETVYQAPEKDAPQLPDLICNTVEQLIRDEAKGKTKTSGDILVFCAGEREIRDAANALRQAQLAIEVLPLYSRLSVNEQNKVFKPAHRRKVVLATNVAETSITVPGIAYVIDPGVARISRYSFRAKVQRLPIEAISQASANQRMGRCGRVANGVCIRLYSETDFAQRAEFTQAEILRSSLASVVLKMLRLGIKDIDDFDFLDRPDSRLLNDGFKLLEELNAVDTQRKITKIGQQMSDLPVDPRYARILVAAQSLGCLRDALILVSGLSIQDPRERPADKQQQADQAHKTLQHDQSDFFSYLNLWQAINNARDELSNTQFKQLCLKQFWSVARVFEWRELYRQLAGMCKQNGWQQEDWATIKLPQTKLPKDAQAKANSKQKDTKPNAFNNRYELLHRALLAGLLSNIASKNVDGEYLAARNRKINLFPTSSQAKRKPKWLVAAEFIETSRLFVHNVGEVKPDWIRQAAPHLCRFNYSAPHYEARSGMVKAQRTTLLYGLTLLDKEAVNYGPINATESRQIFVQKALVENQYKALNVNANNDFLTLNHQLISDIEKLETKTRRRNLLVNDQIIFDFYAERIPDTIHNRNDFEQWLKQGNNDKLKLNRSQLLAHDLDNQEVAQFPDCIEVQGKRVDIIYKFDPGQEQDGVTMVIPISVLAPFPAHIGDWLVPGLLREKCIALIKTLPKQIRRNFAPAADAIDRVMPTLAAANAHKSNTPLHQQLAEQLFVTRGVKVTADDFNPSALDDYYRMNYRVMDVDGSLIDEDRQLNELKHRYADSVQRSVHADNAPGRVKLEKHNITEWGFGELHDAIEYQHQGMTVRAFPMLSIRPDQTISLLIHDQQNVASYHTHNAILALAKMTLSNGAQRQSYKYLQKELLAKSKDKTAGGSSSLANQLKTVTPKQSGKSAWLDELIMASLRQACFAQGLSSINTADDFNAALSGGAKNWVSQAMELEPALITALRHRDNLLQSIDSITVDTLELDIALEDIKSQLYRLLEPHFLRYTQLSELKQYPRYLRAIESRLDKLKLASKSLSEEVALMALQSTLDAHISELDTEDLGLAFVYLSQPSLREFAILMQEWRVSIFAQHLRTQMPVSEKRLHKAWDKITAEAF